MAPITRSSQHGQSVLPEGSWKIHTEAEGNRANEESEIAAVDDAESVDDQISDDGVSMGDSDAEEILQPLQQTADRVSRQVEDFARRLDRFQALKDGKRASLYPELLRLISAYSTIASSRKTQASSDLLQARHLLRNRQSFQSFADAGQLELQTSQKEADLWQLLGALIRVQDPEHSMEFSKAQKSCLQSLHRYSSDAEVWQAFLSADTVAVEYQQTLKWLHRSASTSGPGIDDLTESLRTKADRGEGVWSAGWLFTKESIKSQKRNRIWPKPLDPSNPGLENSLRRKSDSRRLVAQLDPDAVCREAAALEEADEYHEEAAWVACWELLRRGTSVEDVREWWSERKENWRAVSIGAAKLTSLEGEDREWTRLISLWRANEWAASCFKLCRSDTIGTKHEAAIYGLLCGDLQAPLQICQTTNDHLFVHLNAFLIERYREFGTSLSQKVSGQAFQPGPSKFDELERLVQYCQRHEKMSHESRDPLNTIQSTIIAQDFYSFFLRHGRALARIAGFSEQPSYLIVSDGSREINESAEILASDSDGLRIVAHLQLALKPLGTLQALYRKHEAIAENNIAAYIGLLQQEGKMALIPLYASTLSLERGARVLGAVITDVTDTRERDMMVSLIKKYNMKISRVLANQYQLIATSFGLKGRENPKTLNRVMVTHYVGTGKTRNVKVRPDFMGEEFDDAEELLIRCLEWYRYGDRSCWPEICRVASAIYRFFITNGRLAAARVLCHRAPLSQISKSVLDVDLSDPATSANGPSREEDVDMVDPAREPQGHLPASASTRGIRSRRNSAMIEGEAPTFRRAKLVEHAQTWRQLEQLVDALDNLEKWNQFAEGFEKSKNDATQFRNSKKLLQAALDDVRLSMTPLLEAANFLSNPSHAAELTPLTLIRNHYLPECVLAYNSVLYFAGHAISRTLLVECMNLAQVVATNDNIAAAFMDSSRMKELVTAFALSSHAMLHANEQGRGVGVSGGNKGGGSGGRKKVKRDEGMEMWQVRPQDVGLVPDKAMQEILGREIH